MRIRKDQFRLKPGSISARLNLLVLVLFALITLVCMSIVLYSVDNHLSYQKNGNFASQTLRRLQEFSDSPHTVFAQSDPYYFYIAGDIPGKNDPLARHNMNKKMLQYPQDAKIYIHRYGNRSQSGFSASEESSNSTELPGSSDSGESSKSTESALGTETGESVLLLVDGIRHEIKITRQLHANSKSERVNDDLYYFCVPFQFERFNYYLVAIYDAQQEIEFKKKTLDLSLFLIFVSFGILFVFLRIFIKTSLEPLSILAAEANNIDPIHSGGNLKNRLAVPNTEDEIAILAKSLNQMLDKIERSYQKNKQFTQDASHELRIPLTVILGNLELLETFREDPEIFRESLETVKAETYHMKSMIEQLLTITRLENRKLTPTYEMTDLKPLLHHIANDMGKAYRRLIRVKSPEISAPTDPQLLTQLLRSIVENAIKYSSDEVVISVQSADSPTPSVPPNSPVPSTSSGCSDSSVASDSSADRILIKITDFGIGIREDEIGNIKDRFYRSDQSRSSKTGGTGLGLSIAESIVNALNGEISIRSVYGKGTDVEILLPREIP